MTIFGAKNQIHLKINNEAFLWDFQTLKLSNKHCHFLYTNDFLLLLDNIPSLNRLNRPGYRGTRFTRTLAMEWGHLGGPAPTIIYGECVCNPPTWLNRVVLILHIFAILKSNNTKIVVASLLYLLWKWQMVGRRRLLQHSVCNSLE